MELLNRSDIDIKYLYTTTESGKRRNDFQWFKDWTKYIDSNFGYDSDPNDEENFLLYYGKETISNFLSMLNGDKVDFSLDHINIITPKIKALLGLEKARPFVYKVFAVNSEATTRKEQKKFDLYKQYVRERIMQEIQLIVLNKYANVKPENQEQLQQLQQQIQQDIQAMTPPEIEKYMSREYQDPAEVLAEQILEYLKYKENLTKKFNDGWEIANITGKEIYYVGIVNEKLFTKVINPLDFKVSIEGDKKYIDEGSFARAIWRMTIPEATDLFDLKKEDIEEIYDTQGLLIDNGYVKIYHYVWKSLRKIGFLKFIDENNNEVEIIVDDSYKINKDAGDISIEWKWIPEVYQVFRLGETEIYKLPSIVPQLRDTDDIGKVYLPYTGMYYDNYNGTPVSILDRMKLYQRLYDVVLNKLKSVLKSDKGKLLLMNIGLIPSSKGIDVEKWLDYASKLNIMFFDPMEEGTRYTDVNQAAKVVDMGLASDIQKYITLLEHLDNKAGEAVGITKQVIGRIGPNEAVGNTQASITQASYVLEPYFSIHNIVKKRVIERLLDTARFYFSTTKTDTIQFVVDDLSYTILEIDKNLLLNSQYGVFVAEDRSVDDLLDNIYRLTHAALQAGKIDFSDVIKVLKTKSLTQAIEVLEDAERRKMKEMSELQQQQAQMDMQKIQQELQAEIQKIDREGQWDIRKEEERRKTQLQKQVILSMGFNQDKDLDKDNIPDILELYKEGIKADIKMKELEIKDKQVEYNKELEKAKIDIMKKNIKA